MLSSLPWNALWPTNTLWQEPGCTSPSLGQCFLKGLGGPRLLQSHLELRQSGTTFWVKAINSHSLEDPLLSGLSKSFYQAKSSNQRTSPWRGPMHPAIWNTPQGCTAIRGEFSVLRTVLVSEPCCLAGYRLKHTSTLLSSCPSFLSLLLYINFPNTGILANLTKVAKWNTAEHVWKVLT